MYPDRPLAFTRRHALQALATGWSAFALGAAPAQTPVARPRWAANPFALGVASGVPREASVVLWTRLAPVPVPASSAQFAPDNPGGLPDELARQAIEVRWELADDEAFARIVQRGTAAAVPARAHTVHVEVTGLQPDRRYFYRFVSGEATSPTGRTRTAPAAGASPARLRLALASCQHYEQGWYAAHREIAASDFDMVLFVGDYLYESSNPLFRQPGREHGSPVPKDLGAWRRRHALYRSDTDLQAAHAAHPWLLTWDDHEVENDYADDRSQFYTPPDQFLLQRAAAYQAYFEHMPLSPARPPLGPALRVHDQFRWGQLADIWLLDNRQWRSVHACPDDRRGGGRSITVDCPALADPARSVWGAEQEAWLYQGLREAHARDSQRSAAAWKLLGQGTLLAPTRLLSALGALGGKDTVWNEAWDGYPMARERLLKAVAEGGPNGPIRNVVGLGGDVHFGAAANLRANLWAEGRDERNDRTNPPVMTEFVCSSVTSVGMLQSRMDTIRANNPALVHARSDERGYVALEVTPRAVTGTFRTTAFPVAKDARLGTQATFAVAAGRAVVEPA
jgi:alkaline phosphatase D